MIPLGLGLGLWVGWLLLNQAGEAPDYFAQYFVPHPIRDLDTGPMVHWSKAVNVYALGDYVAANAELRAAEQAQELPRVITRFYQGQCLLATGYAREAETLYRKLLQQPAGPHEPMQWYLMLAQVDLGQFQAAREMLAEIISEQGYYAGTAAQLLGELDSGAL